MVAISCIGLQIEGECRHRLARLLTWAPTQFSLFLVCSLCCVVRSTLSIKNFPFRISSGSGCPNCLRPRQIWVLADVGRIGTTASPLYVGARQDYSGYAPSNRCRYSTRDLSNLRSYSQQRVLAEAFVSSTNKVARRSLTEEQISTDGCIVRQEDHARGPSNPQPLGRSLDRSKWSR